MRDIRRYIVIIDGGASPKVQFKSIVQAGATANDYTAVEYPVDSSGDISIYYKITKN